MRTCLLELTIILAVIASPGLIAAEDCPTAQTVSRGSVVVERGSTPKTVQHIDDTLVHTVWRSDSNVVLESTQYQGLFDLERLNGENRSTFRPKTDLAVFFPLRIGEEIKVEFEVTHSFGQVAVTNDNVLLVVKSADTLDIGPCKYDVLTNERSWAPVGVPPQHQYVEFYSPLLKLVVAKAFKNADGTITRTQYDWIYSR
jgi:hypothetical protein